jgi:hypothetical protein
VSRYDLGFMILPGKFRVWLRIHVDDFTWNYTALITSFISIIILKYVQATFKPSSKESKFNICCKNNIQNDTAFFNLQNF